MKQEEHNIQSACVNWFRYQFPEHLIFAIPNGGQRNKIVGARMKEEGVLPGIPDLFIPVARNGFHGLFIEMKAGKNKLTDSQEIVFDYLMKERYNCWVCYSFDEFRKVVNNYFKVDESPVVIGRPA